MTIKVLLFVFTCMGILPLSFAQNVGIGTGTPTRARFEVHGAVDATSAIFGGESSGISLQRNWPGVGFNSYWNAGNRAIASGFGSKLYLDPNSGYLLLDMLSNTAANAISGSSYRALTISPNGYVGIGNLTPHAELQLPNTLNPRKIALWETANNNNQYFGFGIESGTMRYNVGDAGNVHRFYAGTGPSTANLLMSIWGNKSVIISDNATGGGRLGINTGFPGYTIEMVEAGGKGMAYINPANGYHFWELRCDAYSTNVSDALTFYYDGNNAPKGWFRPTDGGYTQNSDRRLKKDILPMQKTLDKVLLLEPSGYHFKNDVSQQNSIGFIAQDVEKLFPELVDKRKIDGKDTTGELYGINYAGIGVIAIKAIQEQQQIINDLKYEMEKIKEQNKILLQLINTKK